MTNEGIAIVFLLGFILLFGGGILVFVYKLAKRKPSQVPESPINKIEEEKEVTLKQALANTESSILGRVKSLFSNQATIKNLDEIEEILITADVGVRTTQKLMQAIEENLTRTQKSDYETVASALKNEFAQILTSSHAVEPGENLFAHIHTESKPSVWLIVGVNGAGKTTTIGKLSAQLAGQGKKVLVAAGDTFRAAAGAQLKTWTDRAQVEIFSPENVTDPSAVAFDAVAKAKAQNFDVVIVDTAGRLHTQSNLMDELKKLKRVITKVVPEAPHETLIVLDANSGQNALIQAREFHQALTLTGVVLTKMDGTAKGGVTIGLANELQIPIRFVGVGEKISDLRAFSPSEFIESLF